MRVLISLILFVAALLPLTLVSCGDDDGDNGGTGPNSPPTEPIINVEAGSPADGATGVSREPILRWTATDPDGDRITYDVYFDTQADPGIVAGNLSDPLFAPLTELGIGVTYYWRVVAEDEHGEQTSSPIWHFQTATAGR